MKLWATSNTCQCCQPTYYCNLKKKEYAKNFSWKFWIDLSKCPILLGYREQSIKKVCISSDSLDIRWEDILYKGTWLYHVTNPPYPLYF